MTTHEIFESYLEYRIDRAGALTPGKKVALVEQLIEEAHQGRVPVSRDKVAQLPVNSRSVQAVLAGEPVSMGQARMKARTELTGAAALLGRAQGLSTGAKIAVIAGIFLFIVLVGVAGFGIVRRRGAQVEATPAPTPESTPEGSIILSDSSPAKKPNDPASIQIGMTSFVLGRGRVKNGIWQPVQAEWLQGTEVRRVIAVPRDGLEAPIERGDMLRVRTRSGAIVPYEVVEITEVQRTQIEALSSLEPSLVVILYDDTAASTRTVVIAQLNDPEMGIAPIPNTYLVNSPAGEINLRERPYGAIVGVLKNGTVVEVLLDAEPVNDGGYKWVRVRTSYGAEGWVASQLLAELPDN